MTRNPMLIIILALLLALLLSGCGPQHLIGGAVLLTGLREHNRIVNPDCPPHLTLQSGEFGGFCDRRTR